jgi:DNA-directed RNA polymerase subunit beta
MNPMTVTSSSNQGLGRELERESGNNGDSRYDFSKIRTSVRIPNLIEVQRESYDRFLQMDLLPP